MADSELGNPAAEHKRAATRPASVAVVTLSSSRSAGNDQSGDLIQELLEAAGHSVTTRKLIPDDPALLRTVLQTLTRDNAVSVIITTGGTGLAASDITVETVRQMLDKELQGFNALFVQKSYRQVRSAAMLSRALAGTMKGKPIFCLPGSPRACKLALEALIIPELRHILLLTSKDR